MRIAVPSAGVLLIAAAILGKTAIKHWIGREAPLGEKDSKPRYFVLVDDAITPSIALVTMAAWPKDQGPVREVRPDLAPIGFIPRIGHVTGFQDKNVYGRFTQDLAILRDTEDLSIEANWRGIPVTSGIPKPKKRHDEDVLQVA